MDEHSNSNNTTPYSKTAMHAHQSLDSDQKSPPPTPSNSGNSSLVSAINNGYQTASKEFEKFFTAWGFIKRPMGQESQLESHKEDKHYGKRKRDADNRQFQHGYQTLDGDLATRTNDSSAIYGRIIPDENRHHSLSSSPHDDRRSTAATALEPPLPQTHDNDQVGGSPRKRRHTDFIQSLLKPPPPKVRSEPIEAESSPIHTSNIVSATRIKSSPPSYVSFEKCKDWDQQEQDRLERLKRSIETLESKSSLLHSPKRTRTVRFSPIVEHATITTPSPQSTLNSTPSSLPLSSSQSSYPLSAYTRARQSLSLEPPSYSPKRIPATLATPAPAENKRDTGSRLHDSPFFVTKSATYVMEDTDRLPSKPLPPPPPQRLPTPSSSLDSEPLMPTKKKTSDIGKSHKETMAMIIHQIPTVKLRRTDTIRGPDGQAIPNRFWNEIYNNGKYKSRPL